MLANPLFANPLSSNDYIRPYVLIHNKGCHDDVRNDVVERLGYTTILADASTNRHVVCDVSRRICLGQYHTPSQIHEQLHPPYIPSLARPKWIPRPPIQTVWNRRRIRDP